MSKKSVFSYFVVAIPILFRSYMRMRKSERGKLTQRLTSSITGDTTICFVALFCFFCVCGKVHTVPYIPRLNKLIRINGIPENVPCSVYRMGKPKYAWILSVDKLNFWVMKTLQHKLNEDTNKKRQEIERGGGYYLITCSCKSMWASTIFGGILWLCKYYTNIDIFGFIRMPDVYRLQSQNESYPWRCISITVDFWSYNSIIKWTTLRLWWLFFRFVHFIQSRFIELSRFILRFIIIRKTDKIIGIVIYVGVMVTRFYEKAKDKYISNDWRSAVVMSFVHLFVNILHWKQITELIKMMAERGCALVWHTSLDVIVLKICLEYCGLN